MGRESGGNGGRAQMNFVNATTDMKWKDHRACLVGWYGQYCICFFKSMRYPFWVIYFRSPTCYLSTREDCISALLCFQAWYNLHLLETEIAARILVDKTCDFEHFS